MDDVTESHHAQDGTFSVRVATSIGAFSRKEWESLVGTSKEGSPDRYNPFISYDFLTALEDSGCAVTNTG